MDMWKNVGSAFTDLLKVEPTELHILMHCPFPLTPFELKLFARSLNSQRKDQENNNKNNEISKFLIQNLKTIKCIIS